MHPATSPTRQPRASRLRRRLLIVGASLALIVVVVVIAGIAALRSGVTREIVTQALREQTGLRVDVGAVKVGLLGESTMEDVVVRLPDEEEPILTAPEVRVHHASAPAMLITRDPGVTGASIESPQIEATEDGRGGWNLARAAACIRDAVSRVKGAGTPRIEIENGTLHLRRYARELRTLPVRVKIEPDGSSRVRVETSIGAPEAGEGLNATASLSLDDWTKVEGRADLRDLDVSILAPLFPSASLAGRASGSIVAAPDGPPETPVRLTADLKIADGSVHHIQIGDLAVIANAGRGRLLIEKGELGIAGGMVTASSRTTQDSFLQINVEGRDVDVRQLVRAARDADSASEDAAGRLDFRASFGRRLDGHDRLFGDANISVREAELQPIPAFSLLYSVLNLDIGPPRPTGQGQAFLRLEGDVVEVTRLQYYNRGTDVNGSGRITNIWDGGDSPVDGALVATVRPLKGSKLPFGPELDQLLGGVLEEAASVRVSGTLADPRADVVPFGQVVSFIEGLFGSRSHD